MIQVLVKANKRQDKNYNRLFARLDAFAFPGRVLSLWEEETDAGWIVALAYLPDQVKEWLVRQKDFQIV